MKFLIARLVSNALEITTIVGTGIVISVKWRAFIDVAMMLLLWVCVGAGHAGCRHIVS